MVAATILLLTGLALPGLLAQSDGSISGTVVNRSGTKAVPRQTPVVLRVRTEGQFVPFRETVTDAKGMFRFDNLPVGTNSPYLPGANWGEVHYPGPRVFLTPEQPRAAVELSVCDAVTKPNPLVIRQYEILISPEPGILTVTESMLVDNASCTCYVGESPTKDASPVTLQLQIPPDFDRATFNEEFFGRRFTVVDGKVVTGIPWPPGRRELKFTYVLRNTQSFRSWLRPLDLPCSKVLIRVQNTKAAEVACDLPRLSRDGDTDVVFESDGPELAAGHLLSVELGHLPVSWISRARWLALAVLGGLIAVASWVVLRRPSQARSASDPADSARRRMHRTGPTTASRSRAARKRQRHSKAMP